MSQCPLRHRRVHAPPATNMLVNETRLPVTSHPWICLPTTVSYLGEGGRGSVNISIQTLTSSKNSLFIPLIFLTSHLSFLSGGVRAFLVKLHNPHMDWVASSVASWSTYCHSHCLRSPPDLSAGNTFSHDLGEVFNKEKALSLLPHRPYNCAIDLVPGAPLPSSRLYNLLHPEREAI